MIQYPTTTVGTVVDTNDPQQLGRLKVLCPALNDDPDTTIYDLPWAQYVSPVAGNVQTGTRGPQGDTIEGPTAYGMWAIPKVGAQVLVMVLDNNPMYRVWIGCLHTQFANHTMPHGRYSYNDDNGQEDENKPYGPYDTFENAIAPLYQNFVEAFGEPDEGSDNFEYQTRAADFQAAGITRPGQLKRSLSNALDDSLTPTDTPGNLSKSTQGYQVSRIDPNPVERPESDTTDNDQLSDAIRNLDNMVMALVSAGFHAVSMDDRAENCRFRIRTTSGHQIIFDDTNERIYLATAKGENWVELDQAGNVDVFTTGKFSVNAAKDINFKTGGSFRVEADRGVHLDSGKEIRASAHEDLSLRSGQSIRATAKNELRLQTTDMKTGDISIVSAGSFNLNTTQDVNIKPIETLNIFSGGDISMETRDRLITRSQGSTNIGAPSDRVVIRGNITEINGSAPAAPVAEVRDAKKAQARVPHKPNRVPQHEPWARVDSNDFGEPIYTYTSDKVNVKRHSTDINGRTPQDAEQGDDIERGPFWRR